MREVADTLLRNDSLRQAAEQLFLQGARFGPAEAADTLQNAVPAVTAADIFGPGSALAAQTVQGAGTLPLSANPLFQTLVLLLAGVYALMIYRHTGDVRALFSRSTLDAAPGSRFPESRGGNSYSRFLNFTGMLGLLLAGTLAVKCADIWLPEGGIPYCAAGGISLLGTAALLAAFAASTGLLRLIGTVTLTQEFASELLRMKRTTGVLAAIATGPALLFFALCPPDTGDIWAYIITTEIVIIIVLFLRRTLRLFLVKKISILHWFLYLCVVEVFPVSLIWLLIVRQ